MCRDALELCPVQVGILKKIVPRTLDVGPADFDICHVAAGEGAIENKVRHSRSLNLIAQYCVA